jgi:streptogramin lyase
MPSAPHQPGTPFQRTIPLLSALALTTFLFGCGTRAASTSGSGSGSGSPPAPAFTGQMRSGSAPVQGASISFYAAGNSGLGTGSTSLLSAQTVTTDASGNFSIPAFQCPSASAQVYLVGRGGRVASSSSDNPALVMIAALGDCSSLTTSTTVAMNEVTTVAAAWALNRFIGPTASIGSTSTNTTGLRNAFLTVANLADNSKGTAPGPALPANSTLETAKLNTLADILWTCDQAPASCAPLFTAATVNSAAPSDTLAAALNIVRNPAANMGPLFALLSQGPFQPVLPSAPHDWLLSLTYGKCTSGCGGLNLPGSLAIDSKGNVWVANYFGGAASEFSPTGAPASPDGFPAAGLNASFGIAVDAQDSVWITNALAGSKGSVTHLSTNGADLSGGGYTGGGIYLPCAVAATPGGPVWIADYANAAATLLAKDGTPLSGAQGYAASSLIFTTAVAVDASQNGWFAYQGGVAKVTPSGAVTNYPCCSVPAGIALDTAGNIWVADFDASAVVKLSPAGALLGQASQQGGLQTPDGIAVDGSGNLWAANYHGNTISQFAGPSVQPLSPAAGFGLDAGLNGPFGAAVDAGGNLWVTNAFANTLTEFVGAAAPVKTPLLGPPAQP